MQHSSLQSIKTILLALVAMLILAFITKLQQTPIDPLSVTAPQEVFSGGRALQIVEFLSKEQVPHVVDMPANRLVEQRIIKLLSELGYQASIQQADVCLDREGSARCTTVRNIIVKVTGINPSKGILLSAHYDSVPAGPGVSDAITAVGTLLETARLLSLSSPPKNTIVFLFNEGEEYGLMGAKAFMEQHPLAKEVQIALNVEARGTTGKSVMFETGEDSGWLVDVYASSTPSASTSSLFYEAYKALPNDTDLTIFKSFGMQGLNFAHAENLPHYHTPLDNLQKLNPGSLQHHGDNVWGVLKQIKDADLSKTVAGNLVYSDIFGLFVISWPESINLALTLICSALFLMVLATLVRSQKLSIKAISITFVILLVSIIFGIFISFTLQNLVQALSSNNTPWLSNGLSMRLTLWLGIVLVVIYLGRFGLRNTSAIETWAALGFLWMLCSILSAISVSGISFLFLIPLIATCLGLVLLHYMLQSQAKDSTLNKTHILIMLLNAFTFVAVALVLEIMLTFSLSLAIGAMLSFSLINLLPVLAGKNLKVTQQSIHPLGLSIFGLLLICVLWTSFQPSYSQDKPQHLNITYVQQVNDQSYINIGHQQSNIPAALLSAIGESTKLEKIYPWSNYLRPSVVVDSQQLESASVDVIHIDMNTRQLTIEADFPEFIEISLYIPTNLKLKQIIKGKQRLDYANELEYYPDFYEYRCRGKSCAQQLLTLRFDELNNNKNAEKEIFIVTSYTDLPKTFQHLKQARGSLAVPVHDGDKSLVIKRIQL
jgi:hypothetical protein